MEHTVFKAAHPDSRLCSEWLYLHAHTPRERWRDLQGTAAFWLGVHHSLRRRQNELERLGEAFLDGRLDWRDYRSLTLHTAAHHFGNLHGHHRIEDDAYFPRLRAQEPKLCRGFDLLDRDHDDIAGRLKIWENLIGDLKSADHADRDLAARLHQAFCEGGVCLLRHLSDEEDLVIPVLAAYD